MKLWWTWIYYWTKYKEKEPEIVFEWKDALTGMPGLGSDQPAQRRCSWWRYPYAKALPKMRWFHWPKLWKSNFQCVALQSGAQIGNRLRSPGSTPHGGAQALVRCGVSIAQVVLWYRWWPQCRWNQRRSAHHRRVGLMASLRKHRQWSLTRR